jgi:uncharacterized protein
LPTPVGAAEALPPKPKQHFNDYAGVVPPEVARRLNASLEQFERERSSQILVVVYPKMQSDSSIEDFTFRLAESWKVGQQGRDNGAVLFVFIEDRKMFIQVGYGLEGPLPDATARQIIETVIKPHFKEGHYAAGLTAGVEAMLAAVRGEFQGSGRTAAEGRISGRASTGLFTVFILVFLLFFVVPAFLRGLVPTGRRRYGRRGGWVIHSGGFSGGGWRGGGGGFGGGGFSGGGGRFGGGGAGGSW